MLKQALYKWFYPSYSAIKSYLSIVTFMLWVLFWVYILYLSLPVFASLFRSMFNRDLEMSDFIMLITAGFLMATLYETKKTNDQNREASLRPIILRTGFVSYWSSLKFTINPEGGLLEKPLEFKVFKNMATNISGTIRISGKSYKLLFSHDVTKDGVHMRFIESWKGWVAEDNLIYAIFIIDNPISNTDLEDGIIISYDDMEGHHYTTIEDSNFVQKTFKD